MPFYANWINSHRHAPHFIVNFNSTRQSLYSTSYLRRRINSYISTWPQQLQLSHLAIRNSRIADLVRRGRGVEGQNTRHPQIRDKFDNQLYLNAFNCKSNVASIPGHAPKQKKNTTQKRGGGGASHACICIPMSVQISRAAYKSLPRPLRLIRQTHVRSIITSELQIRALFTETRN